MAFDKSPLIEVLSDLHDELDKAFRDALTIEAKDAIYEAQHSVGEALDALIVADFVSRDDAYTQAITAIDAANQELKKLQAAINQIIKSVEIAARVAGLIGRALELISKVPLP